MNHTQRTGNAFVIEVRSTKKVGVDLPVQTHHISEAVVNPRSNKHITTLSLGSLLCQISFDTIKIAITDSPILIFPNPKQVYTLVMDAAKHS